MLVRIDRISSQNVLLAIHELSMRVVETSAGDVDPSDARKVVADRLVVRLSQIWGTFVDIHHLRLVNAPLNSASRSRVGRRHA